MFAENSIERRLKSNLEKFHDLQKLKTKPVDKYTEAEFQFVKDIVCADGLCQLNELVNSGASYAVVQAVAVLSLGIALLI